MAVLSKVTVKIWTKEMFQTLDNGSLKYPNPKYGVQTAQTFVD